MANFIKVKQNCDTCKYADKSENCKKCKECISFLIAFNYANFNYIYEKKEENNNKHKLLRRVEEWRKKRVNFQQ